MRFEPHPYQQEAIEFLQKHKSGALLLDPGAGKTAITLSYIVANRYKTLIIAPLRVVYSVWRQEAEKWEQFRHLRFSVVHGTPAQRIEALEADADVYLINPEAIPWMGGQKIPDFDCLIVDESTKFKNWSAKRTKALRKIVADFDNRVILTGTPIPNTMGDLFSQMYIADLGESLGITISRFRALYFLRGGYQGHEWVLRADATPKIEARIRSGCYRIDMSEHLDLPDLLVNDVWIDLPPRAKKDYKKLEREMLLDLSDERLVASNAGAKYNMCRQMANGFIYTEDGYENLHDQKLQAIDSILAELQGKPVLIAYQYNADYDRLCRHLKTEVPQISGRTSGTLTDQLVRQWNEGQLPLLAVQPLALSHGINMQSAGNDIIWLGLTDSLETYKQLNARLHRQGVQGTVRVHRVLARRTVDIICRARIESKDNTQKSLLESLKEYRDAQPEG